MAAAAYASSGVLTLTNRPYRYHAKGGDLIGFYPPLEDPGNPPAAVLFNNRNSKTFFAPERRG